MTGGRKRRRRRRCGGDNGGRQGEIKNCGGASSGLVHLDGGRRAGHHAGGGLEGLEAALKATQAAKAALEANALLIECMNVCMKAVAGNGCCIGGGAGHGGHGGTYGGVGGRQGGAGDGRVSIEV